MDKPLDPSAKTAAPSSNGVDVHPQLRGETIAFALQNLGFTLGANFIEPAISNRFQRYRSDHDPSHPRHGNYKQNLLGEFVGDFSGFATLTLAEALIPNQLHSFTRGCRRLIDPLYTTAAHIALGKECDSPDYERKVERWKTFQERNLVRSAIMSVGGIAGNVASQKLLIGNPTPTKFIFQGKLLSTACTTALGLVARIIFPDQMRRAESWLGKKIRPLMEDDDAPPGHAERLTHQPHEPPGFPAH